MKLLMFISIMIVSASSTVLKKEFSNTYLLCGQESKDWYLKESSIDENGKLADCRSDGAMYRDNTYNFQTNGTLVFDNGSITKIEDSENGTGCTDLKNYVGEWELFDNDTKLTWQVLYEEGNPNEPLKIGADTLEIISLSENELILMTDNDSFIFNSK